MKEKPDKVVLATRIMWVLWGFGTLYLIATFVVATSAGTLSQEIILPLGIMYCIIIGSLGFLVYSVSKGRNWARLTYSIFICFSIFVIVLGQFVKTQISLVSLIIPVGLVATYTTILWLLFHSESKLWFRVSKAKAVDLVNYDVVNKND